MSTPGRAGGGASERQLRLPRRAGRPAINATPLAFGEDNLVIGNQHIVAVRLSG